MKDQNSVVLAHYDSDALSTWRDELEIEGFAVQGTTSGRDALARVSQSGPDALVLDALLPKMNGLQVLKNLKDEAGGAGAGPVVVMVLDEGDTYTENRALICGADAIVKRDGAGRVPPGALGAKIRSLIAEQGLNAGLDTPASSGDKDLKKILETAADNLRTENPILAHITDELTGLFNADYLGLKVAEEFKRSRRFAIPLAVVQLQLKSAKKPEDSDRGWRHALNEVAGLLLCESRDIDVLARPGLDRFAMLLPHTPETGATAMIERILASLAERELTVGDNEKVFASAGLAQYCGEGLESGEELLRQAEQALESAWRDGGSCLKTWTSAP
ncbi:MAG: diguanylate cyclase [Planctomycetota bacterium]